MTFQQAVQALSEQQHDVSLDDLMPPERFHARYPDQVGSMPRLRYLLRTRESNGLMAAGAVVKQGRKLFIVVPRFRDWLLTEDR